MSQYAVRSSSVGLKEETNHLVRWILATPILATWFMASFLPAFGMFDANRTALTVFMDILFFALGFVPMLTLFVGSRLAALDLKSRDVVGDSTRGAGLNLAAYGFLWLTLYSIYRYLI
ncbi:MAG: hypothetical protein GC152_03100 [Alphaproteobacteria bacterium]|nr:hypothetical protein [Alphaproteobacteria bacterium]